MDLSWVPPMVVGVVIGALAMLTAWMLCSVAGEADRREDGFSAADTAKLPRIEVDE